MRLVYFAMLTMASASVAQETDGCRDVLEYSGRNYSTEVQTLSIALKVYDQYCENDSYKSGTNFDATLDTVIKAIPIKFGLSSGSTEERLRYFCKTFNSDYQKSTYQYKSTSLVDSAATNAWLACKQLSAKGVLFRPRILKTQAVIEVARTNAHPVSVQGIIYDSDLLTCSVPNSDSSAAGRAAANENTRKALTEDYWPISCKRTAKVQDGTATYPEADISVSTTAGTFPLTIPPDARFPYRWASDLTAQQKQLTEDLQQLQQVVNKSAGELARVNASDGRAAAQRFPTRGRETPTKCEAGQYVSSLTPIWNSDKPDAQLIDLEVSCRKAMADAN